MVPGNVFPVLMTRFSDFFAIPLTDIYNAITRSKTWPTWWKREFVTVIPKGKHPESLSDLRNISSTMLASKIWLKAEVTMRSNQYDGVRGHGTDHVLVQLWQRVLRNAEDYRSGTVITSINFLRAFNRMSFQECLKALARNGASSENLQLVATFLFGRTMTVKVGSQAMSTPRAVRARSWAFSCSMQGLSGPCRDERRTVLDAAA